MRLLLIAVGATVGLLVAMVLLVIWFFLDETEEDKRW